MKYIWYSAGVAMFGVFLVYLRNYLVIKEFNSRWCKPEEAAAQFFSSCFKYRKLEIAYVFTFMVALAIFVFDLLTWIVHTH